MEYALPQFGYLPAQGYNEYMPQYAAYPHSGYFPQQPQQGYAPQYAGYAPQQGYDPQYTGYAPQPQQGYDPQYAGYAQQGYAPQYAQQYGGQTPAPQPPAPIDLLGELDALGLDADALHGEPLGSYAPLEEQQNGKPARQTPKALRLLSDIVFWMVCIALVGGSVLFAVSKDPRKSYLGFRTYSVKTESMTPRADGTSPSGGFRKGDMIIVKMCKPQEIKVNDIITFNPSVREEDNALFLTHRVVDIQTELGGKQGLYFVTRGDFNNSDDPPISSDMLIGKKVFHIPGVGSFLQSVREHFALALTTILCLFACIFMFKWYFAKPKDALLKDTKAKE